MKRKLFGVLAILVSIMGIFGVAQPVYAGKCGGVETAIIDCDEKEDKKDGGAIFEILAIVLNIVTYGVGAAAVIGVMIAGFQYMTAKDNPAQVSKAKNRLIQIAIGLAIWVLFWGVLQFLLPGGLFAGQ